MSTRCARCTRATASTPALRELDGGAGADARPATQRQRARHRSRLRARAARGRRAGSIRRWPRRASTKPCSPASSSTPGSRRCRPPTNSPSTPRPIRSTRCARNLVGLSFAVEPGTRLLHPARPRLSRARRRSSTATRCWTRCGRCSPTPASARSASTASTTCTCCAATASRCAATPTTRCSRASCSTPAASRHDMDSLAKRYLGYDTIKYDRRRRQGRQADPVLAGRARRRHPLRRRGCRRHPAPAPRAARRSSPPSRRWSASTARSRCRWCRCSSASRPTAC